MKSTNLKYVPLGDVVDIVGGGTPSKRNQEYYGGNIPWATVRDMHSDILSRTEHSLTPKGLDESSSKLVPAGEVVIATRVGLGKVCLLLQDTAINQDLRGLVPKKTAAIDRKFLFYWYKSVSKQVIDAGTGATVQGVKLPFVKGLAFPKLDLTEQRRIVEVLDKAFEGLARARTNAETNLANARELYSNLLEDELNKASAASETNLGNHIDLQVGFAFKSKGYTDDPSGMRLMRGDNIVPGGTRWDGVKRWPQAECDAYEKYALCSDDVLIAMDRTWIKSGIKFAVLTPDDVPSLLVQRVARLRPQPSMHTQFLAALIGSKLFEKYVLSIQTGTGVPHISGPQIQNFPIKLPSLEEQSRISGVLGSVKAHVDTLSADYEAKLQDIDDLRQSLLQKAFAGELT